MALQSEVYTITAPVLRGIWIHDPYDPENSITQFLYHEGNSRSENNEVLVQGFSFNGRQYPVWEFGEHATRSVELPLVIPFDHGLDPGPNWQAQMDYIRNALNSKIAHVYRDKRGRLIYGIIAGIGVTDVAIGSNVALTIQATNFDETEFYVQTLQLTLLSAEE